MSKNKLRWILGTVSTFFLPVLTYAQQVKLIEPLGDETEIPIQGGAQTFLNYFNSSVDWILSVAVGFCVIWVLVGGFQIMLAGSDSGKKDEGKSRITWAILGLTMLLFAGFLLRSLNSLFFK